MLPKFLIADNSQDSLGKLFVVHTESPKFILEGSDEDFSENQLMHWLEDVNISEEDSNELIALAEKFLDVELANQEDLYDDMDEE